MGMDGSLDCGQIGVKRAGQPVQRGIDRLFVVVKVRGVMSDAEHVVGRFRAPTLFKRALQASRRRTGAPNIARHQAVVMVVLRSEARRSISNFASQNPALTMP